MGKLRFDELDAGERDVYWTIACSPPLAESPGQLMEPRLARLLLDAAERCGHQGVECSTFPYVEQYARRGYLKLISADAIMLRTPHEFPVKRERLSTWRRARKLRTGNVGRAHLVR